MNFQNLSTRIIKQLVVLFSIYIIISPLRTELQPLSSYSHKYIVSQTISIRHAQSINITLPQLDSKFSIIRAYQLKQEQYKLMKDISSGSIDDQQLKDFNDSLNSQELSNKLPIKCQLESAQTHISKVYQKIHEQSLPQFIWNSYENKLYHLVLSRSILYSLNTKTMTMHAFHFSQNKFIYLSSYKFPQINGNIAMATNKYQQILYIFTQNIVWGINTKTILTDIYQLTIYQSYQNLKGLDKIILSSQGLLIGLHKMIGVYLIRQNSTFIHEQIKAITFYKKQKILPQDIQLINNQLYILDLHKGIYIFILLPNGQIRQKNYIQFITYGNFQFKVYDNSIFIVYNDQDGSKIVQVNYKDGKDNLVRYYKSNDFVTNINIFVHNRQSYLFVTADQHYLEIYPYNIDPRMISRLNNGIKLQIDDIKSIYHIMGENYIIITQQQFLYIKLQLNKPYLKCGINQQKAGLFRIQIINNISSCQSYNHLLFKHKNNYNQYCQLNQNYLLFITDPQLNQFHKITLYALVGGFVLFFMAGLICLIQWRNNKLVLLQRLKQEIVKFRNRTKRMQPFVQQQQKSQQITVQIPKILEQVEIKEIQAEDDMKKQKEVDQYDDLQISN